MNYQVLHDELTTDPLGRGYEGMTNEEAATSLNALNRTVTSDVLSSAQIYECVDVAEYAALTEAEKDNLKVLLGLGENIQVGQGTKARTVLLNLFGAGSDTITELSEELQSSTSRAAELGLALVTAGDVQKARAYPA